MRPATGAGTGDHVRHPVAGHVPNGDAHPAGEGDDSAFEDFDLENYLPHELGEAHVLWDKVNAPFAFFENGV